MTVLSSQFNATIEQQTPFLLPHTLPTHLKFLRLHRESGSFSCEESILMEDGSARFFTRQVGAAEESMARRVFWVLILTLLLLCSLLQVLSDPGGGGLQWWLVAVSLLFVILSVATLISSCQTMCTFCSVSPFPGPNLTYPNNQNPPNLLQTCT